jgi:hypothetical protein
MSILSPQKFTSFPARPNRFAAYRSFFYSSELNCALQRPRRFERASFSSKMIKARSPH